MNDLRSARWRRVGRRARLPGASLAIALLGLSPAACDPSPVDLVRVDVVRLGSGDGSIVARERNAIECGSDCSELFSPGSSITLDAVALSGSEFVGWDGAGCEGTGPCVFVPDQDVTVTATFVERTFLLSASVEGDGGRIVSSDDGLDCPSQCTERRAFGRRVRVRAVPEPGFRLAGWEGACTGLGPCGVTFTADKSVAARFEPDLVRLDVIPTGDGRGRVTSDPIGIDCGDICALELPRGSRLVLGATGLDGDRFVGWSGDCGADPCELVLDAPKTVRARFEASDIPLRVRLTGSGLGLVVSTPRGIVCGATCEARFPRGTRVVLAATADTGSDFASWSGACSGAGECSLTVTAPVELAARFDARPIELRVSSSGAGSGRIVSTPAGVSCASCNTGFAAGTELSLRAEPADDSTFEGWGGACFGTGDCTLVLDQDTAVSARFGLARRALAVSVTGVGGGRVASVPAGIDCPPSCEARFDAGAAVTLFAAAATGSEVRGWSGASCTGSACIFTMGRARSIGLRFEPELAYVAPGRFTMGSTRSESGHQGDEWPLRDVRLTEPFFLRTTEVTQAEWRRVMGTEPSVYRSCGPDCPVESISFDDAIRFVNTLSERQGLERCYDGAPGSWQFRGVRCRGWRLPTEAEWEYAARAGTTTAYYSGDNLSAAPSCAADANLEPIAWYCGNATATRPVAQKRPNAFGLYDMLGNVAEWVHDRYSGTLYATDPSPTDPTGPATGDRGVVRGGSWNAFPRDTRAPNRQSVDPSLPSQTIGLRPARSAFVRVPASAFTMGAPAGELGALASEAPAREVVLSRDYWIGATEVTQAEWAAHTGTSPSSFPGCGPSCPVETIDWEAAIAYANARSAAEGRTPCYTGGPGSWSPVGSGCDGYRLPSEAEWERAARAGDPRAFHSGPIVGAACVDASLDAAGWFCGNAGGRTSPVATKAPNAFGLFDVHGNVGEWVEDRYGASYSSGAPRLDPAGPATGTERVSRGGAYDAEAALCRSASRLALAPDAARSTQGVRLAASACASPGSSPLGTGGAPQGRTDAAVGFDGARVFVFGGQGSAGARSDGAIYDVATGSWVALPQAGAPAGGAGVRAVWSGERWLVWGSGGGARFSPRDRSWSPISGGPGGRAAFASAFDGREWYIVGGLGAGGLRQADGARYVPGADVWLPLPASPLGPISESAAAALPDGRLLLAAGEGSGGAVGSATIFDPLTATWTAPAALPGCSGVARAARIGGWVVLWSAGGWCRYEIATGTWSAVAARPAGRVLPGPPAGAVASSGAELMVYGGSASVSDARLDAYDPGSNSWRTMPGGPNDPRSGSAATWTGCALWVWSNDARATSGWSIAP